MRSPAEDFQVCVEDEAAVSRLAGNFAENAEFFKVRDQGGGCVRLGSEQGGGLTYVDDGVLVKVGHQFLRIGLSAGGEGGQALALDAFLECEDVLKYLDGGVRRLGDADEKKPQPRGESAGTADSGQFIVIRRLVALEKVGEVKRWLEQDAAWTRDRAMSRRPRRPLPSRKGWMVSNW